MLSIEIKGDQREMNQRLNERGGILSFAIVGAVLALLLLGGILLAKQQARWARNVDNPETAITENEKPSQNQPQQTENGTGTNPGSNTQAPTTGRTGEPSTNSNTTGQLPVSGPSEIPSAGPEDVLGLTITLAMISAGLYARQKSQKTLRTSALK